VTDSALEKLANAVLIPPFPGTTAPRWLLTALERGLAGVTLFAPNMAGGLDALASLTQSLRSVVGDPIVATDEEGGDVTRIWYQVGSPYPGNAALGVADDVALTREVYTAIGRDLAALGINLDFAPCLDVLSAPSNPVIGTRSFGADTSLVARHGAAAVRGLQSAGVAACAKHFPGHGSALLDSHMELAEVIGGADELDSRDLPPFQAAIAAGVMTAMPGHLRVPWLTGDLPASLSASALSMLREKLGFGGVIVTDGLEMGAVSDGYGIPGASVRALAAGCDLLCLGRDVPEEGYLAVHAAICDAVRAGEISSTRLEEAAARVAWLRARSMASHGFTDDGSGDATLTSGGPRSRNASEDIGSRAASQSLQLEGPRPELRNPFVAEVEPLLNIASGRVRWGLADWVPADSLRRISAAPDPEMTASAIVRTAAGRSVVLVMRNAHHSRATQDFVAAVLAVRPDTVLVEMGLPYWRPPAGTYQSYLATYGASRANAQAAAEFLGLAHAG
jgi:beta-N-acetylhexosaminidase